MTLHVGYVIRKLRDEKGWTQLDLAAKAHVRPNTISDLERGKKNSRIHTLEKVAEGLGVTVADLYFELEELRTGRSARSGGAKTPYPDELVQTIHELLSDERFLPYLAKLCDAFTKVFHESHGPYIALRRERKQS